MRRPWWSGRWPEVRLPVRRPERAGSGGWRAGQLLSKSPWPRAAPTGSLAAEQAVDGLPRQAHDASDLGDAPPLAAKLANHVHLLLGRLVGDAGLAAAPGALAAILGPNRGTN